MLHWGEWERNRSAMHAGMHAVQRRGRAAAAWDYAPVAVELVIDVATNINNTGGHAGRVLALRREHVSGAHHRVKQAKGGLLLREICWDARNAGLLGQ